jgi:LPXTG-motif cell wall-anchored protein
MKKHLGKGIAVAALVVTLAFGAASAVPLVAHAQPAEREELVSGWFRDRQVEYYDFGTNTPEAAEGIVATAPIFVFIHGMNADGSPQIVEGQHNVVDVVPGDTGYSDLWQVNFVTVPMDYQPDSITSLDEINASGFPVEATNMLVNCPIVPAGTVLANGEPLVQGWSKGQEVFYPDFGANPATAAPIWVLIYGMNPDGTPDFVEGQNNIIDTVPGDPGYTAFWDVQLVTVPADYEPNSIRSAADVLTAGFEIADAGMVVNCPVVSVAEAASPAPTGTEGLPSAGSGGFLDQGGSSTPWALYLGIAGVALLVAGGGVYVVRRRVLAR